MDWQQWPVAVPHQIVTQADIGQETRVGQMQDAISRLEICMAITDSPTDWLFGLSVYVCISISISICGSSWSSWAVAAFRK